MFSELCLCYCRHFSNIPYLQSWISCITHCVSGAASSTSAIPNTIRRLIILFVAQDCGIGISSVRRATVIQFNPDAAEIFLSTPSVRRATPSRIRQRCHRSISIHALRAEGDTNRNPKGEERQHFYPRPPCGGRPIRELGIQVFLDFYPRPPCGGRRCKAWPNTLRTWNFYPRPPCGGRRAFRPGKRRPGDFYPRPPCGGRQAQVILSHPLS